MKICVDDFNSLNTDSIMIESCNDEDMSFVVAFEERGKNEDIYGFYLRSLKKIYIETFQDDSSFLSVQECLSDIKIIRLERDTALSKIKSWMSAFQIGNKLPKFRALVEMKEYIDAAILLEESDDSLSLVLDNKKTRCLIFIL